MTFKIYTKTGDKGETGLFGGGRVLKNHKRVDAYGHVDELNALLGLCLCGGLEPTLKQIISAMQHQLFNIGAELATSPEAKIQTTSINEGDIIKLEQSIDNMENALEPLKTFILPGGSKAVAQLHYIRTMVRKTERVLIDFNHNGDQGCRNELIMYFNRLSDWFFVASRFQCKFEGIEEVKWEQGVTVTK